MKVEQKNSLRERIVIASGLIRKSFSELKKHDPLRMAGATAFFTTFALPPILILLFQLFQVFLSRRMLGSEIREMLTKTVGPGGADAIRETARGFRTLMTNWFTATLGFLFLMFVATTLFSVIKNTVNEIWNIQVKSKPGLKFRLQLRARSLAIIFIAGMLFLLGIFLDSVEVLSGNYIDKIWPGGGRYFKGTLNEIVGAVVVTSWFIILFRFVGDARPAWKATIVGGILTGILFSIGKSVLSYLMQTSNIGKIYGPSGPIVLILLFVFYSSFILYFGASFIKVYSEALHLPLKPVSHAYRYQLRKIV